MIILRNIPLPSTPQKHDPNEPTFDPSEILGATEWDADLDEGA
jgi:hypothetical protein